jgi:hypothetical protein
MAHNWETKVEELHNYLVNENWTLIKAADFYGVTKQRILQVIKRYLPQLDRRSYGISKAKRERVEVRQQEIQGLYNRESFRCAEDLQRAFGKVFTRKKQNAKYTGWEWSVTMSDIKWPTHCPILGLELDYFAEFRKENSPSFDRIDSSKGYVAGNVQIISWRANRIKNDGTAEEHRKIAEFLDSIN